MELCLRRVLVNDSRRLGRLTCRRNLRRAWRPLESTSSAGCSNISRWTTGLRITRSEDGRRAGGGMDEAGTGDYMHVFPAPPWASYVCRFRPTWPLTITTTTIFPQWDLQRYTTTRSTTWLI